MNPAAALQLADWRRRTAALYARVREQPDLAAAHALWREGRDQMMRSHPQSPLPAADPIRARAQPDPAKIGGIRRGLAMAASGSTSSQRSGSAR